MNIEFRKHKLGAFLPHQHVKTFLTSPHMTYVLGHSLVLSHSLLKVQSKDSQ